MNWSSERQEIMLLLLIVFDRLNQIYIACNNCLHQAFQFVHFRWWKRAQQNKQIQVARLILYSILQVPLLLVSLDSSLN